ncbi:MAG: hypothetical protein QNJ47_06885 [Nostocaceae cyanobacterium]|nr:hypothetical protein [Nostocaceae cyanobacterium]
MNTTADQNLLVLTLYIIGVIYTFNRMIDSIADKIKIEFDPKKTVAEQLKKAELEDKIEISFGMNAMYSLDELKELSLSLKNKSKELVVYVDWDNSSFVGVDGRSRRLIRKSPGMIRDLAVSQTPSPIVPEKTLKETVTAEDALKREENGTYTVDSPIATIPGLKKGVKQSNFSVDLVLRISEAAYGVAYGKNIPPVCSINCPFNVTKLHWTYALPWNKKR